jgi:hypothetical protein
MGILYRIDKEQGIAFTVWDGAITPDEQMAHLQRMAADPDWPAKKPHAPGGPANHNCV